MQVEVQEPEAYMYDGEYERKAAELNHPDLISIRQSTVSAACLTHVFLTVCVYMLLASPTPWQKSICSGTARSLALILHLCSPIHNNLYADVECLQPHTQACMLSGDLGKMTTAAVPCRTSSSSEWREREC